MSELDDNARVLDHIQHIQRVDESIFLGLQIVGGHILLPILVLTIIFSRKVKRHPIFVAFCISWIFSSIVYSIILYRGRSKDDLLSLQPTYNICLIQASLVVGVQVLTLGLTLSLVLHLFVLLISLMRGDIDGAASNSSRRRSLVYTCSLIGIPFVAFAFLAVYSMIIGSPEALDSDGTTIPGSNLSVPTAFYCVILQNADFTYSLSPGLNLLRDVYIIINALSFSTLCLEVAIVFYVFRNGRYIEAKLRSKTGNWKALFIRVALFSLFRTVCLALTLVFVLRPDETLIVGFAKNNLYNGVIDLLEASLPIVVFLIFGLEKDILSVWMFWRKDSEVVAKSDVDLDKSSVSSA